MQISKKGEAHKRPQSLDFQAQVRGFPKDNLLASFVQNYIICSPHSLLMVNYAFHVADTSIDNAQLTSQMLFKAIYLVC